MDLGPNQELLEKKRQEREAERRRIRETASSRRRSTGEERARAIREMQEDARKRDERARHQISKQHEEDEEAAPAPSKQGASFLTEMTKRTHGITGDSSVSLSERLRQNRHTNQRSHESFT
eukprot:scaffold22692_cov198-Cylindrotheca_fusiformis.AAC.2